MSLRISDIVANTFTKIGGTSSQYLMADGSVSTLTNLVTGSASSGQIAYWNGNNTITGSSQFTFGPQSVFLINNSISAGGIAVNLVSTVNAAANNDIIYGLRISPTFSNGSFTGVTQRALGVFGDVYINGSITSGSWQGSTITVAKGGTGLTALGTAGQLIRVNSGATALEYFTPTYLTSYTETDTLSSVTGRGATTSTQITLSGKLRMSSDLGVDAGSTIFFGREENFGGTDTGGTDYGYITFDNNNTTYGGTGGTERSVLRIGTQNDAPGTTEDNIALEPAADLYLNPGGGIYRGNKTTRYTVWDSGNLTNLNQLTNGPGYLTAEADTLATVTGRGATTSTDVTFGANSSSDQGIRINYGNYVSGYGRIRFLQDGSNHSTIHSFSATWQNGGVVSSSTGAINIDGQNGVTIGAWNGPDVVFVKNGASYYKNSIYSTLNLATGRSNLGFNVAKTILGNIHIQNGAGPGNDNGNQAAITFQGGSASEAQAGIYVLNNNSYGTSMGFAVTESYAIGPQLFMTATNNGIVNFPRATPTVSGNAVLHAGNYTSYTLPIGGSWYGANLPGSRWGGYSVNGGEIVFGRDLPNNGQMGMLVDGAYLAGENNGFWSLPSDNNWNGRRGMYWDGSQLNFTTNSPVGRFSGLMVDCGAATGRSGYAPGTLNIILNSSSSGSDGVCGIDFRSGNNYPSDGASIYFENSQTGSGEVARLVIRVENDTNDSILMRAGYHVYNATTVDIGGQGYTNPIFLWQAQGNNRMELNSSGNLVCSGDVTAYGSPSDIRLKTIKETIQNPIEKIKKISGYRFDWNEVNDILKIKEDVGVIAQEIAEVLPELARTNENGFMSVRYQGLTALLIEAIKEQQNQIEELKSQIKNK